MKRLSYIFLLVVLVIGIATILYLRRTPITPLTKSWEKVIPHQIPAEGLSSLSANECGACHLDIYNEWKNSTHAHAWTDPQYQAELKNNKGLFVCLNCHIPLQNQQEYIVEGLLNGDHHQAVQSKNPNFNTTLQSEGITCAVCHVRDGAVIAVNNNTKAPHKVVKNSKYLSEQLCLGCHNATETLNPMLVCTFETGDEWDKRPERLKDKNCIECHFPTTERAIVYGGQKRTSHFHGLPGSGIAKNSDYKANMLIGFAINDQQPIIENDSILYSVTLKNAFAGHHVPTGDPERFIIVAMEYLDKNDSVLETITYRIGEEWEWYPAAKKLSDNNLKPDEDRNITIKTKRDPNYAKLRTRISKHRMNQDNKEYNKLDDTYPVSRLIFEKRYLL